MARIGKTKTKTTSTRRANPARARDSVPATTKTEKVVRLLRGKRGATIPEMMKATGWQAHSVRGFLSGTVRKKLGLDLRSEKPDGDVRRYHVEG